MEHWRISFSLKANELCGIRFGSKRPWKGLFEFRQVSSITFSGSIKGDIWDYLNTVIIPNVSLIFDWRLWSNSRTSRNEASLSLVFYVSATDLVEVSMPGKVRSCNEWFIGIQAAAQAPELYHAYIC